MLQPILLLIPTDSKSVSVKKVENQTEQSTDGKQEKNKNI